MEEGRWYSVSGIWVLARCAYEAAIKAEFYFLHVGEVVGPEAIDGVILP